MTNETLHTLETRRSCRAYKPEQITKEELEAVLRAGTFAPSAMNRQSAKIVVVQDAETRAQLTRMNAAVMGNTGDPMYGAPTILVVLADANARCGVQDGSLVMGNLMNAAAAIGLGSCWINRAKEEFETEEGKALLKKWGNEGDYIGVGHCTMKPDYKLVAKAKYIHANADLASEIWHEVYKRYYPAKQLDTLVETLQSADAIEADIDNDVNYFLVVLGGKTIGYFAWKMENTALHLLHLYLKPEYRGKALGRDILATCERLARGEGRGRLYCEVHTKCLPVLQFFKTKGYRVLGPAEAEAAGIPMQLTTLEKML